MGYWGIDNETTIDISVAGLIIPEFPCIMVQSHLATLLTCTFSLQDMAPPGLLNSGGGIASPYAYTCCSLPQSIHRARGDYHLLQYPFALCVTLPMVS
jgi:hypothetical protein